MSGVTKRYGVTTALDSVSIEIKAGQIHGLLGQNGSGKSTLIKVLAGVVGPDEGAMTVQGREVGLPLKPVDAERLGFRFVHQNLGLVPSISVAENLFLSKFALGRAQHIRWGKLFSDAEQLLSEYQIGVNPRSPLEKLSPLERAQVAIVRAVAPVADATEESQRNLVVLDEPTVYLPRLEVGAMFSLLDRIVADGAGVLLVTHRMDELLDHTDQVTILRDSRVVGNRATHDATEAELVDLIVGAEWSRESSTADMVAPVPAQRSTSYFDALSTKTLRNLSLDLAPGAIVGLTGLAGSGYEEILYAAFGASVGATGSLFIEGRTLDIKSLTPRKAMDLGIGLVPADRLRQGVAVTVSIEENLSLPLLSKYFRGGTLRPKAIARASDKLVTDYSIKPDNRKAPLGTLSGGNQQKVVLAKWLQNQPRILLLHEPTQGVDVRARHDIWGFVRQLAQLGSTVLVASSDYEELATLCTSVAIVAEGNVVNTLSGGGMTMDAISAECLARSKTSRGS
ncbi:MAG: Monosaccharide-transporting ATPase [Pseudonocardiales bacterium]|nr:Monosaccharide-transporting ATPase [Pseudonocardiales bacterium]